MQHGGERNLFFNLESQKYVVRNHPKLYSNWCNGPFGTNNSLQNSVAIPREHVISKIQLECVAFGWASMAQLLEGGPWSWVDLSLPLTPMFSTCGCVHAQSQAMGFHHWIVILSSKSMSLILVTETWTLCWMSVSGHLQNQQVLSNREQTKVS